MREYTSLDEDLESIIEAREANPQTSDFDRSCRAPHCQVGRSSDADTAAEQELGVSEALLGGCSSDRGDKDVTALIRLATRLNLGFHRTVALVLKAEWERFLANECVDEDLPAAIAFPIKDTIAAARNRDLRDLRRRFRPPFQSMFELFRSQNDSTFLNGCDREGFISLVKEMILNDVHMMPNNSPEMAAFVGRVRHETDLTERESPETGERFWTAKLTWIERQDALGEILLDLENRRLENANVRARWLSIFGEEFMAMQGPYDRMQVLRFQIELKENDPDLTDEQLRDLAMKRHEEARSRVDTMKIEKAFGGRYYHLEGGSFADDKEMAERDARCRHLIRQIWRSVHPDRLGHDPCYQRLTEKQKAYLQDLQHVLSEVHISEIGYHPCHVAWRHKSPAALEAVLSKVRMILEHAGVDMNEDLVIPGDTLSEKLAFLDGDIERLELGIAEARDELVRLCADPDTHERCLHLACPEQWSAIKDRLLELGREYEREADRLTQSWDNLVRKGTDDAEN